MLSIDGHRVVTTNNLYSALKAVLAPRRGVKFWVDAISINQSDLIERNHQVSQMREVYEHADGVALWLGERGCNSDKAFAFFKAVNGIGGLRKRYEALGVTHLGDEKLWSSGVQELGAVSHLFGRSYWRRIWILQVCSQLFCHHRC